jgi:GT2 family glycosyltransferase/glycosyltransferase involved in cell wall biosynthesis
MNIILKNFLRHFGSKSRAWNFDKARWDELCALARGSELFDEDYYLAKNPDVKESGIDAFDHYINYGRLESRRPSEKFDPVAYLRGHPDVAHHNAEPFEHYIMHGKKEGRRKFEGNCITYSANLAREQGIAGQHFFKKFGLEENINVPTRPALELAASKLANNDPRIKVETQSPDVSIIIPIYGQMQFALNCLDSLFDHRSKYTVEIIAIDDLSPRDAHVDILKSLPWIRYVRRDVNGGFIEACNDGASRARGKFLVFVNSDVRVCEGWLDELIGSFEIFPNAGLVGSKLLNSDYTLQEAGGIYWQDGSAWNYGRGDDPDLPKYSFARQVDYCSGAAIALSKAAWQAASGFDIAYRPAYCEDAEIAFKLRKLGYEVWMQPLSCVLHYEGKTHGTDLSSGTKTYQVSNMRMFAERWKSKLSSHAFNGVTPKKQANRFAQSKMLVVDALTPTPDQDSGSFITLRMIRAYQKLGFHVSFVSQHQFWDAGKYTQDLQRVGVECYYGPTSTKFEDVLHEDTDFQYTLTYRYNVLTQIVKLVRASMPDARIIFHNVDLHYNRALREAEISGSRQKKIFAAKTKNEELQVMAEADCIIVHTPEEKELIGKYLPTDNIVVFPYICDVVPTKSSYETRYDIMFLGGFSHTPNVDAAIKMVKQIWPILQSRLPESARLMIVGAAPTEEVLELRSDRVIVTGKVSDLRPYFDSARVFCAPLRFGAGIKGKVIQTLAHGLPAVLSPIAAEGIGIINDRHVLIADEPQEFAASILKIYKDKIFWSSLQKAGIAFVRKHFSQTRCQELCLECLDVADEHWILKHEAAMRRRLKVLKHNQGYVEKGSRISTFSDLAVLQVEKLEP